MRLALGVIASRWKDIESIDCLGTNPVCGSISMTNQGAPMFVNTRDKPRVRKNWPNHVKSI